MFKLKNQYFLQSINGMHVVMKLLMISLIFGLVDKIIPITATTNIYVPIDRNSPSVPLSSSSLLSSSSPSSSNIAITNNNYTSLLISSLVTKKIGGDIGEKHDVNQISNSQVPLPLFPLLKLSNDVNSSSQISTSQLKPSSSLSSSSSSSSSSSPSTSSPPSSLFSITKLTTNLENKLKSFRNTELGIPFIQEIFDTLDFENTNQNDSHLVSQIADRLTTKLSLTIGVLTDAMEFMNKNIRINNNLLTETTKTNDDDDDDVMENSSNNDEDAAAAAAAAGEKNEKLFLHSFISPCQNDELAGLDQHYDKQQIEIRNYFDQLTSEFGGDSINNNNNPNFTANLRLMDWLKRVNSSQHNFKQMYFLSVNDEASVFNCRMQTEADSHLRYVFSSSILQKRLMIIIDHGSSLNSDQLDLTKAFATNIITQLNERDLVSIVGVSHKHSKHFTDPHADLLSQFSSILYDEKLHRSTPSSSSSSLSHKTTGASQQILYPATMDNKLSFIRFIEQLNGTKELTNHSLAFEHSFDLMEKISKKSALINRHHNNKILEPIEMIYISRGLISPLTEAKNVLETIARGQSRLDLPVIINTCAIVLDEKRVMYEKQFLKDISTQNYTKYNMDVTEWYDRVGYNLSGKLLIVNKRYSDEMARISTALFTHWFEKKSLLETRLIAQLPVFVDPVDKDMIVTISQPFETYGVFGVDMYLSDLAEDIIYFNKNQDSYAFILDLNGNTIYHPSFPRPLATDKTIMATDILYLEQNTPGFVVIRNRMLNYDKGNETVILNEEKSQKITYTWHRAAPFYIICIVTTKSDDSKTSVHLSRVGIHYYQPDELTTIDGNIIPELIYHRVDLIPTQSNLCKHFKQLATMDSITLFLSASSFTSPFTYLKNQRDSNLDTRIHNAKSIMAYIKDPTNLLANPGLLPEIRNDVTALLHIMSYLKKRHQDADTYKNYIIRRYAATLNGVIQIYPGCLLSYDLEPMRRPWFVRAIRHPGKIVMTEPYLDAGGAGYIVTVSHTLYEGKTNALHSAERDTPVAIVSIDLTLGYLYKLLLQNSGGFCGEQNVKCFMMEDRGFLISHPSILEPVTYQNNRNNRRPLEHITHKESYMANDILYHRHLVEKKLCTNYQNRLSQRYYQFNSSLTEVLTNRVHGERTKYQITAIPGTNIFVAILNATSDGGAFCPCSTIDRICLNCNRMEQTNCECPCECPLKMQSTEEIIRHGNLSLSKTGKKVMSCAVNGNDESKCVETDVDVVDEEEIIKIESPPLVATVAASVTFEICPITPEKLPIFNSFAVDLDLDMQMCMNINCEIYGTQTDCLGVMGCEWCQVDVDGETYFTSPFCTQQSSCFNGVLGSLTPYGEGDLGAPMIDTIVPPAYSAIGPVAGAIITLCLVIGFAMYCYRQNLDNGGHDQHLYGGGNSMQDNNFGGLPLSRFDYDDINQHDDPNDMGGNMNRNLLRPNGGAAGAGAVAVADISPYRINGGAYRSPPPNPESDHGYSTMTPREDSEHLCFALAEPLINNHHTNKRISMSDSASLNTSVSSPTNHNHQFLIAIDKPPNKLIGGGGGGGGGSDDGGGNKENQSQSHFRNNSPIMGQTSLQLASPHHIQVPVTVHHPMEIE